MPPLPNSEILQDALATYPGAVRLRAAEHKTDAARTDLVELDSWLHGEFRQRLHAMQEAHCSLVTVKDMGKVMKWKLLRGKFRPRLEALVASNTAAATESAVLAAIAHVSVDTNTESALKGVDALTQLKGVGPATASVIASVLDREERVAFMSDEAAAAFSRELGPVKYTPAFYKRFALAVHSKASELTHADFQWTAYTLEKAIWSWSIHRRLGSGLAEAATDNASASPGESAAASDSRPKGRGKRKRDESDLTAAIKRGKK